MKKKIIYIVILVISFSFTGNSQNLSKASKDNISSFRDDILGFSFEKAGKIVQHVKSTYSIILSTNDLPAASATAHVSVSDRLFIDLPGSYGGKIYIDSSSSSIYRNKVMVDSFNTGNGNFRREYWAVYAGMGMWDCVINCYCKKTDRYYIVSFVQDKQIGKPGEIVGGKQLTSEDLKLKAVSSLKDTANALIMQFNRLLSSFKINN